MDRIKGDSGISGGPHKWLSSYFTDRYQSVNVYGHSSIKCKLPTGFPQGSRIGPLCFKKYTKPLTAIAKKHGVRIHLYADDTQLYLAFDKDVMNTALSQMGSCIDEIRLWMRCNYLKLNDSKTEFIIFHSKHQKLSFDDCRLRIGDDLIKPTQSARNLGIMMDSTFEMHQQIASITRSCYAQLRGISKIRAYLTEEATKMLINALVTSRLDNGNVLLYGLSNATIHKLQLVQHNAARVIKRLKYHDHITSVLKNLHWLPIKKRIDYKIALMTFKSLAGSGPTYFEDTVKSYSSGRAGLRSEEKREIDRPSNNANMVYYGKRSFLHASPAIWNHLPSPVRKTTTLNGFKKELKTHLFKLNFDE